MKKQAEFSSPYDVTNDVVGIRTIFINIFFSLSVSRESASCYLPRRIGLAAAAGLALYQIFSDFRSKP